MNNKNTDAGIILGMGSPNERCYNVTLSFQCIILVSQWDLYHICIHGLKQDCIISSVLHLRFITKNNSNVLFHLIGWVQDWGISTANELGEYFIKPLIWIMK